MFTIKYFYFQFSRLYRILKENENFYLYGLSIKDNRSHSRTLKFSHGSKNNIFNKFDIGDSEG